MKVRELLKGFSGKNVVRIRDVSDQSEYDCRGFEHAVLNYGHFTVKRWSVENDVIVIQTTNDCNGVE